MSLRTKERRPVRRQRFDSNQTGRRRNVFVNRAIEQHSPSRPTAEPFVTLANIAITFFSSFAVFAGLFPYSPPLFSSCAPFVRAVITVTATRTRANAWNASGGGGSFEKTIIHELARLFTLFNLPGKKLEIIFKFFRSGRLLF